MEISRRKKVLIGLLVFVMGMAISASATRVYLGGLEPRKGPLAKVSKEPALPNMRGLIRVETPERGGTVGSPLLVRGEAPGTWFFEAEFPVIVLDGDGREVVTRYAVAEGEWMTEDLVPFRATLVFDPPPTERGTLVLKRANPSGLPEFEDEMRVPVMFASAP